MANLLTVYIQIQIYMYVYLCVREREREMESKWLLNSMDFKQRQNGSRILWTLNKGKMAGSGVKVRLHICLLERLRTFAG